MNEQVAFPDSRVNRSPAEKVLDSIPYLLMPATVASRIGITASTSVAMVNEGRGPRGIRIGTKKNHVRSGGR